MDNNLFSIAQMIDFIEDHLNETLDLDRLAQEAGYSKYHLHRMFTSIVGYPVHAYVQRRRLTEASRRLIYTDQTIMEIALYAGYETQQSFSVAFKMLFGCSPRKLRKKGTFYPLQLKFKVDGNKRLRGDRIMEIRTAESGPILLVGYTANTKKGFAVIGSCMRKLLAHEKSIVNRADPGCLIGLNDYTEALCQNGMQPSFDFYGAAQVKDFTVIPAGMVTKELPASNYVVFSFLGRPKDSLQPVADYIYREWFPQSTCQLNENNRYDFTKSFDAIDDNGMSTIEYWVPVLSYLGKTQ